MRIKKEQLCYSCRDIHPISSNGIVFNYTIGDLLDGEQYKSTPDYIIINEAILIYLQDQHGCPNCIKLFEQARQVIF